jgi:aminodeoxyfutalosine synthase
VTTTLDYEELSRRLANGGRLTDADVQALAATNDLVTLGMLADEARVRRHGRRVTYVRVFACAMDGPIPERIPRAAREVRISGAAVDPDAAVAFIRVLAERARGVPISGFSLADVAARFDHDVERLAAWLGRCREAGLEMIAEAPIDGLSDTRPFDAASRAGVRVARLTVDTAVAGHVELLHRATALQAALGGLHAFAPLPAGAADPQPSTGYDSVKRIALARLVADNIPSIQVDWSVYGPKLAQVALTFGADDLDAVTPYDTIELGPRRAALEEVRRNIEGAALEPVERNGRYERVTS